MAANLVLSLFPGIDLLGRAFEAEGYAVVRGPDILWGHAIQDWRSPPPGAFEGIIGGSPCQDFSRARRTPPTGEGVAAIAEFARVVTEALPAWFLLENVPAVPDVQVAGYHVQRFNLSARDCGLRQRRLRTFQFGSRDCPRLVVRRRDTARGEVSSCVTASEGKRAGRRAWPDVCRLQGLPEGFELPGWSLAAKYRAVGNGVPVPMGRVVAAAIRSRLVTKDVRVCGCDCGREVFGRQLFAAASCRKRMERRRRCGDGVSVLVGAVAAESQKRPLSMAE